MERIRQGKSQLFILACALLGAGIAVYLTTVHYQLAPLACSTTGFVNCERVLSSSYSVVPGTAIPITIPGLAWCLVMMALALAGLRLPEARWLRQAQFAWALVGMLAVLYLLYVEIVRLHNLCAWCTALHVLIFLMFLVTLVRLVPPQPPIDEPAPAEQESRKAAPTAKSR